MGSINNINFYTKIILKITIFLIGFWSFLLNVDAATIESKTEGGNWSNTGTWIGGEIPKENDNVIINGEVIFSTNINILDLTINENGKFYKDNSWNIYNLIINGDLLNNGNLGYLDIGSNINDVNIKGKTINNGTISEISNFYIYGDFENNGNFNVNLMLGEDVEITKKLNFSNYVYLKGHKLKLPNDSYIKLLIGPGEINSQTSINGDGEKITIGWTSFDITSNFETIQLNEIFLSGLSVRNILINNDVYYSNNLTHNGNLIIGDSGNLYKNYGTNTNTININGNLINNGILNGSSYAGYTYINISGNLLNKGNINYITGGLYIKGNIDNINGTINSNTYIKWDNIQDYTNYILNISGNSELLLTTNQYLLNDSIKEIGLDLYWKVRGKLDDTYSEWTETRCINVVGCIDDNGETNSNSGPTNYNPNNTIDNNSNPICSQNISSGENLFDISNLGIKTNETEKLTTTSEDTSKGDPVILSTGEFDYENTLMSYAGNNLLFEFKIKYKNQAYYNGPLGNNFDFNYNIYLTQDETGNINIHDGKLGVFKFLKSGNIFDRNNTIKANLELINDKYEISFDDKTKYLFGDNFKIEKIIDTYGNNLSFEYNNDKQLVKITDALNREYIVSYYSNSRIYKITDFTGNEIEFIYFSENETEGSQFDLKTIKMINGNSEKEINFTYTMGSDFENSHNIIKLIDSANNTYVENTYDQSDRVSSQTYGNGTIYYDYTLDSNNKVTKNSVTDREGNVIDYYYDSFGNTIKKVIKKTSGDLEYTYTYDSSNNLIKEKNPLGNGFTYSYDSKNNLIEKRQKSDLDSENNTNDIVVSFEYDDVFNKVTKEILPNGTAINYTLDNFGNVVEKQTIFQNIETLESFEYNELGQLVSKTDGNGNISNFEYINGNLSKIIKIGTLENIETNFEYDSKGNITKIIDGEGNETNLSYNDFNLLVSQITPEGIHTNFEYNSLNKKTKETIILSDTTNKITNFEYDILDNPTNVTTNIDSQRNKTLVTKYDNDSRIIETQNGSNAKNTFEYDENGNITKKSTILNDNTEIITSYIYDLNDRLIKQINPNNSEMNFEYDLFDRLIKAVNTDSSYTTNTYDNMGNLLEIKSYDSSDNLVSKTSFEYDGLTRKTKQINHLLEENKQIITSFVYDNNGNILSQTNALNQTTTFLYDSFNRLVKTIDNLGNIIEYKYNKNDKITEESITGTNGKILRKEYFYDNDGNLRGFNDNNGKINSYNYNKLGQLISYNDGNNTINYTYDLLGNKLSETNGLKVINYEYDENSNMIKLIDANGNITNYEYDSLNRLVKQIYPDNSYTSYEYDTSSNVSKKIDANGTSINYTYDNQNRLTEKNITNGVGVIGITKENYFYDSLGRLTKTTNNEGSETLFSYDSLNRLTSETQNGKLVNYTYDNLGNRTSIGLDGKTTGYNYDSNSRLETITRENSELVSYNYDSLNLLNQTYVNGKTTTYGYDEYYNRLSSLTTLNKNYEYLYTPNNLISSNGYESYNYDENNNLIQVNFNTRFVNKDFIEYNIDTMGNRLNETYARITTNGNVNYFKDFIYTINNLNQYTNKELYKEDTSIEVSNMQESETPIETSSGTIIELDDTTETEPIVELNGKLIYDKNGNMIGNMLNNKRQYIYSYDYKNRLVKVEKTIYKKVEGSEINEIQEIVKIIQYKYDNLDRRIQKIFNNGSYRNYYYSNKDIILEENYTKPNINGVSKLKTSKYFINGNNIDDVLAMEKVDYKNRKVTEQYTNKKGQIKTRTINETYTETNTYYYHKNHLNSIVAITDNLGNILEEYEYDVFGKPYSKDLLTGEITNLKVSSIGNTRLFTGREYERGLQLYYNRARYYNPELGRFISRDPIDISDDVNLYSYVGNSPVSFVDPMGTEGKPLTPPKTAAEHYARNVLNVDLPKTKDEILKDKNWELLKNSESIFHSYGTPMFRYNSKFVNNDGREAVYDYKTGNLVVDDKNIGSYNYYLPDDKFNHLMYDIIPYIKWGNSENDSTTITERVVQNKEILTAYHVDIYNSLLVLSKETNSNIQSIKGDINSFNQNNFINNFNNYIIYR